MELSDIEVTTSHKKEWKDAYLFPLGDLQYQHGSDVADMGRFKRVIEFAEGLRSKDAEVYYLGMGDMVDRESPSNRAALKSVGFYDSLEDAIDLVAEKDIEDIMETLEPTKGRWLGLLEGHHFHDFQDGTTSDTRLANFLEAPFLGTSAYVGLHFISTPVARGKTRTGKQSAKTHSHSAKVVLWCHHGRGGGQLLGSPLNQLEKKAIGFDADIYLFGHHHKVLTGWSPQISPVWGTRGLRDIRHRDRLMATTGSFLRGYMVGNQRGGRPRGSYVEQGAMNPVTLGALCIKLRPLYQNGPARVAISVESGDYAE